MAFGNINLVPQLRPCLVCRKGRPQVRALFHKWVPSAYPTSLVNNDACPFETALVEFQDGTLDVVEIGQLRFVDHPMADYFYPIEEKKDPNACESYHLENGVPRCWATRERDTCDCDGRKEHCTYYSYKLGGLDR